VSSGSYPATGGPPGSAPPLGGAAVLDLPEIRGTDAGRVGPKIARLGQLARDGWRVPDGYAVTVDAMAGWLPPDVREELGRLVAGGPTAGADELAAVRDLIEAQPPPEWLAQAVAAAHERLAARTGHRAGLRVAVRSSAVAEDGTSASFAGQFATYLGVTGVPDVLHHVRKCWASGFSAHALAYRRRADGRAGNMAGDSVGNMPGDPAGSPPGVMAEHRLAVGVLELVDVRSAGVVFTVDPVSGDASRMVVEANWGFGESVVSGQVTPDHWEADRATGDVLAQHVGGKRAWSVLDPETGRVALRPLPDELAIQACLATHEVRYLCQQAAAIEDAAGGAPQDVEWAIARGQPFPDSVFILQHRPVTTLDNPRLATPPAARDPGPHPATPQPATAPARKPAFDPVQYALRNVFRVPGA
jgi:pyruvate, water dikinase